MDGMIWIASTRHDLAVKVSLRTAKLVDVIPVSVILGATKQETHHESVRNYARTR